MIVTGREPITYELMEELGPMFHIHWEKCGIYRDKMPLDVNKDFYVQSEKSGHAFIYTIRADGKLVGYSMVLLNYQPHYKKDVFAVVDAIYIDPEYRKGSRAKKFMKDIEAYVKRLGISILAYYVGIELDYPELFKYLGYDKTEVIYTKYLKD
jgi:GNAT superfamily N-acetyltransferase